MSRRIVDQNRSFERDTRTHAIVNSDRSAYKIYMQRVREAQRSNDDLKYAVREVNNIKEELKEIKNLLNKLVK
tara:strand:+ start:276 stop:494 length:219 start_codon:yes stop_codon:yes gene_type:complete